MWSGYAMGTEHVDPYSRRLRGSLFHVRSFSSYYPCFAVSHRPLDRSLGMSYLAVTVYVSMPILFPQIGDSLYSIPIFVVGVFLYIVSEKSRQ